MSLSQSVPTDLESGWKSEVAKMEPPVEARSPRPVVKRELKRYRPHPRKVPKAE